MDIVKETFRLAENATQAIDGGKYDRATALALSSIALSLAYMIDREEVNIESEEMLNSVQNLRRVLHGRK